MINNQRLFDGKDKIYIYVNKNNNNLSICKNDNIDNEINKIKIFELLSKINKYDSDDDENNETMSKVMLLEKNIFIKNIGVFKNNVITGNMIKTNYKSIKQIFDKANEMQIFNFILSKYEVDDTSDVLLQLNNASVESIILDAKKYFRNFENKYMSEDKKDALKKGLTSNYKSSLTILVIINLFAEINGLTFNYNLSSIAINNNKNDSMNYNEILEELTIRKIGYYTTEEDKKNITRLAFEIMFIILNLYSKIYEIDRDAIMGYNEIYNNVRKMKSIDKAINELLAILNLNVELKYNSNFKENSLKLLEEIINRY